MPDEVWALKSTPSSRWLFDTCLLTFPLVPSVSKSAWPYSSRGSRRGTALS